MMPPDSMRLMLTANVEIVNRYQIEGGIMNRGMNNDRTLVKIESMRKLSDNQFEVVKCLIGNNGVIKGSYSDLGKKLNKDASNIRKVVKALEKKEIVEVRYKDEYAEKKEVIGMRLVPGWMGRL